MSNYNSLANVSRSANVSDWRFRVKILRIFPWHSEFLSGSIVWHFILADEAGNRIEMVMFPKDARRFPGIENGEGDWAEIHKVQVKRGCSAPFKWGQTGCLLEVYEETQIRRIIDPVNDRHYLDFKTIQGMKTVHRTDTPIDIMGVVFNEEPLDVCLEDPKMTRLVFYIRDSAEFQMKCVAIGDSAYDFQEGLEKMRDRGVVIAVLKMWKLHDNMVQEPWLETYEYISDFKLNPVMDDVETFRQSLANSAPYVARHGPIVFNYM